MLNVQRGRPVGGLWLVRSVPLVGGGEDLGLHQLHRLTAALDGAFAGLDAENLCVADVADESLA